MPECFSDLWKPLCGLFLFHICLPSKWLYFISLRVRCAPGQFTSVANHHSMWGAFITRQTTPLCVHANSFLPIEKKKKPLKFRPFSAQFSCLKEVQRRNLAQANKHVPSANFARGNECQVHFVNRRDLLHVRIWVIQASA